MKQFLCDCVNPVWSTNKLSDIIDNAKKISKKEFLANCDIDEITLKQIKEFPHDLEFFKNGEIYFYTWSAIEYFYGDGSK